MKAKYLFTFLFVFLVSGCATNTPKAQHQNFAQFSKNVERPKVVLLPMDISVYELGVSNMELVPDWTEQGHEVIRNIVESKLKGHFGIEYLGKPDLNQQDADIVDAHVELYYPVVSAEIVHQTVEAWKPRRGKVESTLGPGLQFLKQKTGADLAVFVSGDDVISSGGRVATMMFAAVWGVAIPMGHSYLNLGIVDLETGDVLWNENAVSGSYTFLEHKDMKSSLDSIFSHFPEFLSNEKLAAAE